MERPLFVYGITYILERAGVVQEFETTTLAECLHEALAKFEEFIQERLENNNVPGVTYDVIAIVPVTTVEIE